MTTTVTISEATQRLGMSPRTIHRGIRNGKVNAEKVDGKWYIDIDIEAVKDNGNGSHKTLTRTKILAFVFFNVPVE